MLILGFHISYWLMSVGMVGYVINYTIINHFIKIKTIQIAMEQKRGGQPYKPASAKEKKLLEKEMPLLKWTIPFGTTMFLMFVAGGIWSLVRFIANFF